MRPGRGSDEMKLCCAFLFLLIAVCSHSQTPGAPAPQPQPDAQQDGSQRNGRIYVDGVRYPLTQAGIQQALDDACVRNKSGTYGMDVYLPPTVIYVSHKTGQQFLEQCSLQIHGAGLYSTWLVVEKNVPDDVPVFRIKPVPVGSQGAMLFENFQITTGGSSGGDAFLFDGSNPKISGPNNFTIRKVMVKGLSPNAWAINMIGKPFPANQQGWNHISDNILDHGIHLTNAQATDSWLIDHNTFGSATGGKTPCIDASTAHGAAHITAFNNNGGCAGGFFISHGTTQCKVLYNQIEQPAPSTEPNSAIIDLIGDNYPINGCEIVGNNINAHKFAAVNVRVGRASNTSVFDNVIGLHPKTGVGLLLTSYSSLTRIPFNDFLGTRDGAVPYKNEGATNFSIQGADGSVESPAVAFMNARNTGFYRSQAGSIGVGVRGKRVLSMSSLGLLMSGDAGYCHDSARTAVDDTCINQIAPGVVGVGKTPGADKSALIQSGNTVRVSPDFRTQGPGLQSITGLGWKLPAAALTYSFHCALSYSESGSASTVTFGIEAANHALVHLFANGIMQTGATAFSGGTLADMKSGGAAEIVSGAPSALNTDFTVTLDGTIENEAAAHSLYIKAGAANASSAVMIRRGSYCQLF
jgi:hypothetical protein